MTQSKAIQAAFEHLRRGIQLCTAGEDHVYPSGDDCVREIGKFTSASEKVAPWNDNDAWTTAIQAIFATADRYTKQGLSHRDDATPDRPCQPFVDDVVALVQTVMDGLPYTYTVTFPLPGLMLPEGSVIDLGSGVRLLRPKSEASTPALATRNALTADSDIVEALRTRRRTAGALLEVTSAGFAGTTNGWFSHSALRKALAVAKRVLIGGYVSDAFRLMSSPASSGSGKWTVKYMNAKDPTIKGEAEASRLSGWHAQWALAETALKRVTLLGSAPDGSLENLESRLSLVKNLLRHDPESTNVNHVAAAIEWLFEALQQDNQTLEFVQTCTAIEAIVGSEPKEGYGVTAQLADRCAFLLGANREEREQLQDEFRALYKARSKVVHGIAARLKNEDQVHLWNARSFVRRLLWRELNCLA